MQLSPEDQKAITGYLRSRGRIPITKEQKDLEKKRSVREVVFGIQDGVLSTLSFIAGVAATHNDPYIGSLISGLAGMLSMGIGEYLGTRAESHVVASVIEREKLRLQTHPEEEFLEHTNFLVQKGFSEEEAKAYTRKLLERPEVWLAEAIRDEYGVGLNEGDGRGAIRNGVVLGLAYLVGDLIPTLGWGLTHNLLVSFLTGAATLAASGYYSGLVSQQNPIKKAFELMAYGVVVFIGTDLVISNITHLVK